MPEETGRDQGTTLVASHRVRPGREDEFQRTCKEFIAAESSFPGYQGTELIRPAPGVQEEWITLIRFDDATHMRSWLDSEERKALLAKLKPSVERLSVQEIGGSFGAWFARDQDAGPSPNWKQAMTVLVMLYPAVMIITLYLAPILGDVGLKLYATVFVGNIVSVAALTWVLMPVATRVLERWLSPGASRQTTLRGSLALVLTYAILLAVFSILPS